MAQYDDPLYPEVAQNSLKMARNLHATGFSGRLIIKKAVDQKPQKADCLQLLLKLLEEKAQDTGLRNTEGLFSVVEQELRLGCGGRQILSSVVP